MDCYKDLEEIKQTFAQFKSQCGKVVEGYEKYIEKLPKLLVPGEHNRKNASASLALADFLGIPLEKAKESLANFEGTWRRLEKRGVSKEGTIIYDDYAHHPTEIQASLLALREIHPQKDKKLIVVFQPHLYSRTKALFDDFAKSFNLADTVLLLPIYFAREKKDESISSEMLSEAISKYTKKDTKTMAFPDFESTIEYIKGLKLGPKDVIVTMGAGEAYKIADKVFNLS